jgi:16S rRNA (adenine1518-N6/adenine1519-N6)-dimethyltransferase
VDPTRPSELRELLRELGFKPSRSLGQNFLIDGNIRDIILEAANVTTEDSVLEIGAGPGVLTIPLTELARRVVAVEKDTILAGYLQSVLRDRPGFELIEDDIARVDLEGLLSGTRWIVVANLPYVIASRLLVDLAMSDHRPARMLVMVQSEVADRLRSPPGSKAYGLLSVLTGLRYEIRIVKKVPPSCFWPRPRVWSAVVLFEEIQSPEVTPDNPDRFRKLARHAFAHRRKQLGRILAGRGSPLPTTAEQLASALDELGLDASRRPETIDQPTWCRLANALGREAER